METPILVVQYSGQVTTVHYKSTREQESGKFWVYFCYVIIYVIYTVLALLLKNHHVIFFKATCASLSNYLGENDRKKTAESVRRHPANHTFKISNCQKAQTEKVLQKKEST